METNDAMNKLIEVITPEYEDAFEIIMDALNFIWEGETEQFISKNFSDPALFDDGRISYDE
tara:strand:- start:209 stop:391 length:183 start_codon:yes stop_codon:yes gene_type:complete